MPVTPAIVLGDADFGARPMGNGLTRLRSRAHGTPGRAESMRGEAGVRVDAGKAAVLGLVTFAFEDIDWEDEVRIALEERASLSPDALTGTEADGRFAGPETLETEIFGRPSAWRNRIFQRPGAAGPDGAPHSYGTGRKAVLDRKRV
ncbi:hypothetical protein [Actinomadura keratinilytica]|jgi:benzoyl-CoA-dihydrodiol lyase|uniref:Uncharacterized protein n=1 Tax=Actinomadura keratinilytica TaxID=547461 RepID=A0ABP7Z2T4_9ACTN